VSNRVGAATKTAATTSAERFECAVGVEHFDADAGLWVDVVERLVLSGIGCEGIMPPFPMARRGLSREDSRPPWMPGCTL